MKRTRTLKTYSLSQKIVAYGLMALIPLATMPEAALALPHGGIVSKGSATMGYSTGKLLIAQSTSSATFNWGSYNVKAGQSVVYSVPGSTSVSMNYIGGTTPSSINGKVASNGILYFMNPNGLIFGSGSTVSASGVMAFGSAAPWGTPTGAVTNAGVLTATNNGTVALVGSQVTNSGTITAPGGEVLLAAGSTVTPLTTTGVSSLSVATTGGGQVDDSGVLSAETVGGKTGTILLQSGMGSGTTTLEPTAVLDASAPNGGNGGAVYINASGVVMNNATPINVSAPYGTAGTLKIDPNYILTGSILDICNATGLEYLDTNPTSYLADTINLEGNMNLATGSTLYPWIPLGNCNTGAFTGTFNGKGYTVSGYTIGTSSSKPYSGPSSGCDVGFIGWLGSGGTVENLGVAGAVYASSSTSSVGGVVGNNSGTVEVSYNKGTVSGGSCTVGGVVGYNFGTGTVKYSYNKGGVKGSGNSFGGVVGENCGTVEYSYNTGTVTGTGSYWVGGVIGQNNGKVEYSYNTGTVSGKSKVGGVVGANYTGSVVEYSYNTGAVSGTSNVGGVVGENCGGTYTGNYWNTNATISPGNTTGVGNSSSTVSGVNGLTASQFGTSSYFSGWTFNTWSSGAFQHSVTSDPWFEGKVVSGTGTMTAPMLLIDLPVETVTGNSGTSVYNGSPVPAGDTTTYTMGGSATPSGITITAPASFGPNVGSYTPTPNVTGTVGSPTTQTSVVSVSATSGTWTITALPVTATANTASMTSGSAVPSVSGSLTGLTGIANISADWSTSATSSSAAGSYAINPASFSYSNGAVSGDFSVTDAAGNATALTITAAPSSSGGSSSSSGSTGGSTSSSGGSSTVTGTQGAITSKQIVPVVQTVAIFQSLPSLPAPSSVGTSTNSSSSSSSSTTSGGTSSNGSSSTSSSSSDTSTSTTSMTLDESGSSSLTIIQPAETTGSEILSVEELKK